MKYFCCKKQNKAKKATPSLLNYIPNHHTDSMLHKFFCCKRPPNSYVNAFILLALSVLLNSSKKKKVLLRAVIPACAFRILATHISR